MIKNREIPKQSISQDKKPNAKISHQPNPNAKISHQPKSNAKISHQQKPNAKIFTRAASNFATHFCLAKPMRNANSHLCKLPTVRREATGHLKFLFKGLQSL